MNYRTAKNRAASGHHTPANSLACLLLTCLTTLASCHRNNRPAAVQALPSITTLPPPILTKSVDPVILIYQEKMQGFPPLPQEQVDIAVWGDGRMVWRVDDQLVQADINFAKINDLLQKLHRAGVFGDGKAEYSLTVPDGAFEGINVQLADRQLEMRSCHPLYTGDQIVVTSRAVEALEGRDREKVLAAEPPEYWRFLQIWGDIESTVRSWIPSDGQPFTGALAVKHNN